MTIQLSFLAFLVILSVASTRLIYHDGVVRQIKRMAVHCRMLAALIVVTVAYAGSIGFSVHEKYSEVLKQKDEQIRSLASQGATHEIGRSVPVVMKTRNGHEIKFGDENGVRSGAGSSRRSGRQLRRSDAAGASQSAGSPADPNAKTGSDGSVEYGNVAANELLEQVEQWAYGGIAIRNAKNSVDF